MEWKILDNKGSFIHNANCQYDALDLAVMLYDASIVLVDFNNKETKLISTSRAKLDQEELKKRMLKVCSWSRNGRKSYHKPLLILYSLKRLLNDEKHEILFSEIREDFKKLLKQFSNTKRIRPEYPFLFLENDGIWKLNKKINTRKYKVKQLNDLTGSFSDDIYNTLVNNEKLIQDVITLILETYFPKKLHGELLEAI